MFGPSFTDPFLGGGSGAPGGTPSGFSGRDIIWVDLRFPSGVGNNGTEELPYPTVNNGLNFVPDGGTLMLVGGDASVEPGITINARNFNVRGLGGQHASGGLPAALPTLTYAITSGTQRLAFRDVSVALVHSGTAAGLTKFYFARCPSVSLTAGSDASDVFWVGDATCTFTGAGGSGYFSGGTIAGFTANGSGIIAISAAANITGNLTSSVAVTIVGGCTFGPGVSITAPAIYMDLASRAAAITAGVTFSTAPHSLAPFGTPSDVGTANAAGTSELVARLDHVHNLPVSAVAAALATANAAININGQRITGAGAPVNPSDLVTKAYADLLAAGLKLKTPGAVAVATANQATLSGTAQTIDGVALNTVGMRVLLTAQTTATQNGLWVVQSGAWTRPTDFATGSSAALSYVPITGGTLNGGSGWLCTNSVGSDVVDTNNLVWGVFVQPSLIVAGAGLTKSGNTIDVVAADATIVVNPDSLQVGVIGNGNLADNTIALPRLVSASGQGHFLARNSSGSGAWEDVTTAQAQALLGIFPSGALKAVRAATTASITLSGTQTIDGVACIAGDRVLVKNQATGSQNGVYVVASGSWTRSTDAASAGQLYAGLCVPIGPEGTTQPKRVAMLTTADPITIGTTALTFDLTRIPPLSAVAPLDITDGAAQIGNGTEAAPWNHVHHLAVATVVALLATVSTAISVNSQKITSLANGTVSTDAVNLGQVTSAISTALSPFPTPATPGDNSKVAYANAGALAYAAGVTTSGSDLAVTDSPATGTVVSTLKVTDAAHTALTASTERHSALFDFGQTKQWATGALTTQRALRVIAPTLSFVGASTVTTAATVAISSPPIAGTNATITNGYALWLEAGSMAFGAAPNNGFVNFPSGNFALIGAYDSGTTARALLSWSTSNHVSLGSSSISTDIVAGGGTWAFGSTASFPGVGHTVASGGYFAYGSNPATIGTGRYTNAQQLAWTNAAFNANIVGLQVNASNVLVLGDSAAVNSGVEVQVGGANNLDLKFANAFEYRFTPTGLNFFDNYAQFGTGASAGTVRLQNDVGLIAWNGVGSLAGSNVLGIYLDSTNAILLGAPNGGFVAPANVALYAATGGSHYLRIAGANDYQFSATQLSWNGHNSVGAGFYSGTGTVAASGLLRGANNTTLVAAASATSGTVGALSVDGSDHVTVGDAGTATAVQLAAKTGGFVGLFIAGSLLYSFTSTAAAFAPAAATSGTAPTALTVTGASHTGLSASTEARDITFALNRTVTMSTGALTTQRAVYYQAPTYAFAGASVLTMAATVAISGAPAAGTNATITRGYALLIENGGIGFGATPATSALINTPVSATVLASKHPSSGNIALLVTNSSGEAMFGGTAANSYLSSAGNVFVQPSSTFYIEGSGGVHEWSFGSTALFPGVEHNLAASGFYSYGSSYSGTGLHRTPYASGGTTFFSTKDSGGTDRTVLGYSGSTNHVQVGSSALTTDVLGSGGTWTFGASASFPAVDHNIAAGGRLTMGTTPASGGTIALSYGASVLVRNKANSGDRTLLNYGPVGSDDMLFIGDNNVAQNNYWSGGVHQFRSAGNTILQLGGGTTWFDDMSMNGHSINAITFAAATQYFAVAPTTAPSAPPSGWRIYCDNADGHLKAKPSSGAPVTLA